MKKDTTNQNSVSNLFCSDSAMVIELKDICFAYDDIVALKHFHLNIERGKTYALMGPNGCGKSTLLKLINGLIFADIGNFFYEGIQITKKLLSDNGIAKAFHQRIGFVFQNSETQLFCATVEEEIAFGPNQMGLDEETVRKRTNDCIQLLDIEHLRNRAPYQLSGGEKRKTAIACVLSLNPEVLVLDEPLNTLDEQSRQWLTNFLLHLKQTGKTMIIATHDNFFAELIADYIIEM